MEQIIKEVESLDAEKLMSIIRTLISVDTTNPPGNTYREYIDIISPFFKELGYTLDEIVIPDEFTKQIPYPIEGPRINLVATKDYGQESYVCFYGHMDVVPAPNDGEKKWRYPPFEAKMTKAGKIFGRGVADMKGSMACLLLALQIIEKLNLKPKFNIRVLNCTDEELGVYPGVKYLEELGYVKDIVFSMDGGIRPMIPIGTAGDLVVVVETIGRSSHSGMNLWGINALEEMIPILNELIELKKIVEKRECKDIPGVPNFKTGEKRNMSPNLNLDMIRSGDKANIIPDLCRLTIDRRYMPDERYEDVKQEIQEAIDRGRTKSKALDVRTRYIHAYPPFRNDPNSPGNLRHKKVLSLIQQVSENEINVIGTSGSTDMGTLTGYDVIIHGLIGPGSNTHGVNEYTKLSDAKMFIKELITFLCADL